MEWVNMQYRSINFLPSNYSNELIAIAEVNGERAGVGRLVRVNEHVMELGGMFVADGFRKLGIARSIVTFLITQDRGITLYCLPFEHLQSFYESCGFELVVDQLEVPEPVLTKWKWCNTTYTGKTLLLAQQV